MHPDISSFSSDISNTEIVYIKNFLSEDECATLLSKISTILSDDSQKETYVQYTNDGIVNEESAPYVLLGKQNAGVIDPIVLKMVTESKRIYESLYGEDPDRTFIELGTVNVMGVGNGMDVHADNPPSLAHGIDTPHGLVLYLNDDYEGGEIYYPKFNIAIKPEAGSLVIHPGTIQYSHGVSPVISGTRYATTAFSKKKLPEIV